MKINYIKEDKLLNIKITEEIDHHSVEKIRQRIDYEVEVHMPKQVVFDFENVTFMDSAGIGMIIGRYKLVSMIGGKLKMVNVNRIVKKIFEMSGILQIIPIIENNKGGSNCEKCI